MIKNYFKTTLRNLWKNKGYSFLNIFGLAVGITAAALIFIWVESEVTKNDHFLNKKDIYITKSKQSYDQATYVFEATPGPLGPAIKQEIPGIKHVVRTDWGSTLLFSVGDNNLYQKGYHADPEILDVLSVEFLRGNRQTALSEPNNIILSESGTKRLFGDEPALGRTLRINNDETYTVSGIVKDFPKNSSFQFNWLIPFKKYQSGQKWLKTWGNNGIMTLVQLEPNANVEQINKQLLNFVKNKTDGEVTFSQNFLYPMSRWNLYNSFDKDGNEQEGHVKYVRLFSIIAWVILIIACINFMNLATARSGKRAKEVGMRKVVGAGRKSLIGQFLGESIIYAFLSALLAIAFIYIFITPFNTLVGKELSVDLFKPSRVYFIISIVLACGLLAGSYPALYLSAFSPLATIKSAREKSGTVGLIRRGLVILQYTSAVVLIICTSIIYQQIQHIKNRDMGFDRSRVLTTPLRGEMLEHMNVIKQELTSTEGVEQIGLSNLNVMQIGSNTNGMDWDGKNPEMDVLIGILHADENLIPTLGMTIEQGRNFRQGQIGDSSNIIINQAFAKLIKPEGNVVGHAVRWGNKPYTVVGVVKDFIYNNVYNPSEPMFFHPFMADNGIINIRTKSGTDLSETVTQIEQIIKTHNPGYPFEYQFLDDTFNNKFQSEMLIQKLASVFAILAIIISCLGLFGLASYSAERRTKEIGIRKVLGASVSRLVGLLNKEFVILVGISCVIAFPIAWWFMHKWLGSYNYRIQIQWEVFALAAVVAIGVAVLTISTQAFKAAVTNPIKNLRTE